MADPSAEDKDIEQLLHDKAELEAKVKRLEQDVYKLQLERDVLEKAGRRASVLISSAIEKKHS